MNFINDAGSADYTEAAMQLAVGLHNNNKKNHDTVQLAESYHSS